MGVRRLAEVILFCVVALFILFQICPDANPWSPAERVVQNKPVQQSMAVPTSITTITTTRTTKTTTTRTSTMTTTAHLFNGIVHHDVNINSDEPALYAISDVTLLPEWSSRHNLDRRHLPRVLIYTWCTEDTYEKFVNEIYWKECYAHAHGFDIIFSGAKNFTGVAKWVTPENDKANWTTFDQWYSEDNMWAWWHDIRQYLFSGKYDYVFMMGADSLILESNLKFPVWAWDRGHDMTVMDQYHFLWPDAYGLNENNILFRPTEFVKQFIEEGFEYRTGFHLQGDNGPYMQNILTFIGREVAETGRMGYEGRCTKYLSLEHPGSFIMRTDVDKWIHLNEWLSQCFFYELDRFTGPYGARTSKSIGFSPTFYQSQDKKLMPSEVGDKTLLAPWANCWSSVRKWWPNPTENCFAFHYNGPKDPDEFGKITGKCPDPTFKWDASPYNYVNRPRHTHESHGFGPRSEPKPHIPG